MNKFNIIVIYSILYFTGCTNSPKTIEISEGNVWMKEWLKVDKFKNGDSILYCQDERS